MSVMKKTRHFRLPDELDSEFAAFCQKSKEVPSQVVRRLIQECISRVRTASQQRISGAWVQN